MSDQVVQCPHCSRDFQLTAAIAGRIEEKLRAQFETAARAKDAELQKQFEILAARAAALEASRAEFDAKLDRTLDVERRKLAEKLESEMKLRLASEHEKLKADALKHAQEACGDELGELRGQIAQRDGKLKELQNAEVELRRKQRELEDARCAMELDLTRKLDEERARIKAESIAQMAEEQQYQNAVKEKLITDLRMQIDALKRKAEQGSQQTQGEVLELQLEQLLKAAFPLDRIEPIPKGEIGADVIQRIVTASGQACGAILWESKRTKSWMDAWIPKLKADMLHAKTDVAVLMTSAMPKDIAQFGFKDGVFITNMASAMSLAAVLRVEIIELTKTKSALSGRQDKMELLYNYLCSSEFRQRVESIAEAFDTMQKDLNDEKKAMLKIWERRQKQIDRVIQGTAQMHGSMQAIIGSSAPRIERPVRKQLPPKIEVRAPEMQLLFDVDEK